jgi:hypothetical protein
MTASLIVCCTGEGNRRSEGFAKPIRTIRRADIRARPRTRVSWPITGERTVPDVWHENYWYRRHVAID